MTKSKNAPAILVVDDNRELLAIICEFFKRQGFRYFAAPNPLVALEIWNLRREAISVLVSDLRMPEMFGDELARKLLADKPSLNVLLMSGTPMDYEVDPRIPLIVKPFQFSEFLEKIREMLPDAEKPSLVES